MAFESQTVLYAVAGALCLIAGGAGLRSASVARARGEASDVEGQLDEAKLRAGELRAARETAERGEAAAKAEAKDAEVKLGELAEKLAAAEARAAEAREQAERLATDVMAEDNLVRQMDASLNEVRAALTAAQNEAREARAAQAKAEERVRVAPAGRSVMPLSKASDTQRAADQIALASARAELVELRKTLESVTKERDVARGNIESLERLVAAVRARSRELSTELETLKKAQG